MKVDFYVMSSDIDVINKEKRFITTKDCQVEYDGRASSVFRTPGFETLNPILNVEYSEELLECNYMYIPVFKRYYFVEMNIMDIRRIKLIGSVDALESWWSRGLSDEMVHVVRNQYQYNMYMTDEKMVCTNRPHRQIVGFKPPPGGFQMSNNLQETAHTYVLNSL